LYAVQTLNKAEGGAFAGDLFFLYGSQDRYSVFSAVVAPLVSAVGVRPAFLLLYLASNGLFFAGLVWLLRGLFRPATAALAALILAALPLPTGGFDVLCLTEGFMTPRVPAKGLALFGLTAACHRRYLLATLLVLGGCLLHPLIALPAFPLMAGWACVRQ